MLRSQPSVPRVRAASTSTVAVLICLVVAFLAPTLPARADAAAPTPAPERALPADAVTLWAGDAGDLGRAFTSFAATDVVPDLLRAVPYAARTVSVAPGTAVALYSGAGFQGACVDVQGTIDLRRSIFAGPGETGRDLMPASLVVGEDCTRSSRGSVGLCAQSCSDIVWTDRDIRSLGPTGFNDKARQVHVVRPSRDLFSVALYSDDDFAGTCQTVTEPITDLTLPGSTVGGDQVSSLRVNYTCQGPVTAPPVVTDVAVVGGRDSAQRCASGYTKSPLDLNKSMGGDFIYACLRYGPLHARMPYAGGLFVVNHPLDRNQGCERDGYRRIDHDLNAGAGGDWVYFCLSRPTAVDGREVEVLEQAWSVYDVDDADGACRSSTRNHVLHDVVTDDVTATERDLNSWNVIEYPPPGLRSIYTCRYVQHRNPSTDDAVITVPASLATVGDTARFRATASTPDGFAQRLTCNGVAPLGALGTREGELFSLSGLPTGTTQVTCRAPGIDGTTTSRSFVVTTSPAPPPSVVAVLTAGGGTYQPGSWSAEPVDVRFECRADAATGGPAIVESTVGGGGRITGPVSGASMTSTGTCRDSAGRTATPATVSRINVDPTAPAVEAWPADGVELLRGSVITPRITCEEPDSPLTTCGTTDVDEGGHLLTADAGPGGWTAEGGNEAGLITFVNRTYTVVNPRPVLDSVRLTRDPDDPSTALLEVRSASLFPDSSILVNSEPTFRQVVSWSDPEAPGGQTVVVVRLTDVGYDGTLSVTATTPAPGGGGSVPVVVPLGATAPVEQVTESSRQGRLVVRLPSAGATLSAFADDARARLGRHDGNPAPVDPAGATGRYVDVEVVGAVRSATATLCELNGGDRVVGWDGTRWVAVRDGAFDATTACVDFTPTAATTLYAAVRGQAPRVISGGAAQVVVDHGDEPSWNATWADPEGDPLTFTATGLPRGVVLSVGASTTRLTGTAAVGAGRHVVTVVATDDAGNATRRTVVVVVRPETALVRAQARRFVVDGRRASIVVSAVVRQPADGHLSPLREAAPLRLTLRSGSRSYGCVARGTAGRSDRWVASCRLPRVPVGRYRLTARVDTASFAGSDTATVRLVRRR